MPSSGSDPAPRTKGHARWPPGERPEEPMILRYTFAVGTSYRGSGRSGGRTDEAPQGFHPPPDLDLEGWPAEAGLPWHPLRDTLDQHSSLDTLTREGLLARSSFAEVASAMHRRR
jgi:hypothetical protein